MFSSDSVGDCVIHRDLALVYECTTLCITDIVSVHVILRDIV